MTIKSNDLASIRLTDALHAGEEIRYCHMCDKKLPRGAHHKQIYCDDCRPVAYSAIQKRSYDKIHKAKQHGRHVGHMGAALPLEEYAVRGLPGWHSMALLKAGIE